MSRQFSRIFSDILQILYDVSPIFSDFSNIYRFSDNVSRIFHGFSDDVSRILNDFHGFLVIFTDFGLCLTEFSRICRWCLADFNGFL